jgi:hypothetical protein
VILHGAFAVSLILHGALGDANFSPLIRFPRWLELNFFARAARRKFLFFGKVDALASGSFYLNPQPVQLS